MLYFDLRFAVVLSDEYKLEKLLLDTNKQTKKNVQKNLKTISNNINI